MNMPLFFGILLALALCYLYLGKKAATHVHETDDYFLDGRQIKYVTLTITILATQLGGGTLIGIADEAYHKGWVAMLYPLGIYLGLMLLSLGFGARLRTKNVTTLPELFERVYRSVRLRRIAGALSAFSMFTILISQGIATREFFAALGFSHPAIFMTFWSVVILYTVMGGLKAVVSTDILQTFFMVGALILLFIVCIWQIPSLDILWSYRPDAMLETSHYINWLIMPMLFMIIGQDMGQRCSAAITPTAVSRATASAATIYILLAIIPISLGIIASQLNLPIIEGHSILFSAIMALTNPFVTTLCAAAILMAIISTADSLLCAMSANVSIDLWPRQGVSIGKYVTLIAGSAAMLLSYAFDNVVSAMITAYEASIYVLFPAIFVGVLAKNPARWFSVISILIGVLTFAAKQQAYIDVITSLWLLCIANVFCYLVATRLR